MKLKVRKELEAQYEKELIYKVCRSADGIGDTTAGAIAEHFTTLNDFLSANADDVENIKNSKGKSILKKELISTLMTVREDVVKGRPIIETWLHFLAKSFIRRQVSNLDKMKFQDLDINPLLAKALDFKNPEDLIRFNLYQSITRSVVTSWGSTVEQMLKYSGCETASIDFGRKGRRADLRKIKDNTSYYFQIKSGPNTMNVDMVESLNEVIETIEKQGDVCLLGMTYGRRDQISQQILSNLIDAEKNTKIGRELWEFISEVPGYHKRVIEIIDHATKEELKKSYIEMIESKVIEFCKTWKEKYKDISLDVALEDYI